jgi:hypothetical protein
MIVSKSWLWRAALKTKLARSVPSELAVAEAVALIATLEINAARYSAGQIGVATGSHCAATISTLQAGRLSLGDVGQYVGQELFELIHAQSSHLEKHGRVAAQLVIATDHQRPHHWA